MISFKYNSDGYDHGPAQYAHSEVLILFLVGFYLMPTLFFPVCVYVCVFYNPFPLF